MNLFSKYKRRPLIEPFLQRQSLCPKIIILLISHSGAIFDLVTEMEQFVIL